jgi:hypothetical protein
MTAGWPRLGAGLGAFIAILSLATSSASAGRIGRDPIDPAQAARIDTIRRQFEAREFRAAMDSIRSTLRSLGKVRARQLWDALPQAPEGWAVDDLAVQSEDPSLPSLTQHLFLARKRFHRPDGAEILVTWRRDDLSIAKDRMVELLAGPGSDIRVHKMPGKFASDDAGVRLSLVFGREPSGALSRLLLTASRGVEFSTLIGLLDERTVLGMRIVEGRRILSDTDEKLALLDFKDVASALEAAHESARPSLAHVEIDALRALLHLAFRLKIADIRAALPAPMPGWRLADEQWTGVGLDPTIELTFTYRGTEFGSSHVARIRISDEVGEVRRVTSALSGPESGPGAPRRVSLGGRAALAGTTEGVHRAAVPIDRGLGILIVETSGPGVASPTDVLPIVDLDAVERSFRR